MVKTAKQGMIKQTKNDKIFDIVVNILVVAILIAILYPLYFIVVASISDPNEVALGHTLLLPKDIGFDCYKMIFKDKRILSGYGNSILYTTVGTVLGVATTALAGYALSRDDLPGVGVIMKLFIFTMYFGGGLIPTYLVVQSLHLVNTRWVLMILGSVSVYNIIIARTFFKSTIPKELLEAAAIDGCGNGRAFVQVVLPLSKAILAVIALYYAVGHWNSFFNALIYVNEEHLYPLQLILREILFMNQSAQLSGMDPDAMATMMRIAATIKYGVIIVSSLPMLILYPFLQKYFVKGVMIGSVKG